MNNKIKDGKAIHFHFPVSKIEKQIVRSFLYSIRLKGTCEASVTKHLRKPSTKQKYTVSKAELPAHCRMNLRLN